MIDNINMESVNETKFLGVVIYNKICLQPPITYIRNKLSKSTGTQGKVDIPEIYWTVQLNVLNSSLVPYADDCGNQGKHLQKQSTKNMYNANMSRK